MGLMRRIHPKHTDTALSALLSLIPQHSADLLSQVDQPLQVSLSLFPFDLNCILLSGLLRFQSFFAYLAGIVICNLGFNFYPFLPCCFLLPLLSLFYINIIMYYSPIFFNSKICSSQFGWGFNLGILDLLHFMNFEHTTRIGIGKMSFFILIKTPSISFMLCLDGMNRNDDMFFIWIVKGEGRRVEGNVAKGIGWENSYVLY